MTRHSVDFVDGDRIAASDRGFTYGDGVFETLRIVDGRIPLWHRHAARLSEACRRLAMPCPDMARLHDEAIRLATGLPDAVARITVSRGEGARGYALPVPQKPVVVVSASALALDAVAYADGVGAYPCTTRLAAQPLLAGMKHLNRLEQVLARAEWSDPRWADGLMSDMEGKVTCATAANLFAVFGGQLVTPPVDRCGVAGVARAEVMSARRVSVTSIDPERLLEADEVFLTSAVRGILPVRVFMARTWQPGPMTRALQVHWRSIGLPLP